jgi:chromosome segregation ATPase
MFAQPEPIGNVASEITVSSVNLKHLVENAAKHTSDLEISAAVVQAENDFLKCKVANAKDVASEIEQTKCNLDLISQCLESNVNSLVSENETLKSKVSSANVKLVMAQRELAEMKAVQDSVLALSQSLEYQVRELMLERDSLRKQVEKLTETNDASAQKMNALWELNQQLTYSRECIANLVEHLQHAVPQDMLIASPEELPIARNTTKRNKSLRRSITSASIMI